MPERLPSFGTIVAAILVLWLTVAPLVSLNSFWLGDSDYTHGYLIGLLTVLLVVKEVQRGSGSPAQPSWVGAVLLLICSAVVIGGYAATTLVVPLTALPALWICAIWAFAGANNARRFALPIGYLYFAVPVWSVLVDPLRQLTIHIVTVWTRAAGMPAYIEGNLIHVPTGTFEVQGGCAGVGYVLVAVALAMLSCLMARLRWGPTVLLLLCAVMLALVGNWLRVFFTVAAGLHPEGEIALFVHNNHTFFGWALFAVLMVPLFYLDRLLQASNTPRRQDTTASEGPTNHTWRSAVPYTVCAFIAIAIWLSYRVAANDQTGVTRVAAVRAPDIAGWVRVGDWQDSLVPVYVGADAEVAARYANDDARVGAYLAHYASQRQEHEVVFSHNQPTGRSGVITSRQSIGVRLASGTALTFQEIDVRDSDEHRLVWLQLRVGGKYASSALAAKLLQVYGVILGRRDAQALVLTARCEHDCVLAREGLTRYAVAAANQWHEVADRLSGSQVDSSTP